jgi:hypothetical protein
MPRLGLNNDGDRPQFCWLFKLTHYRFPEALLFNFTLIVIPRECQNHQWRLR